LQLEAGDKIPTTSGSKASGTISLPATSITFVQIPAAKNAACY
jgi:hypothetical protein